MIKFSEFKKNYLDARVSAGETKEARLMAHSYYLLADDDEQEALAEDYVKSFWPRKVNKKEMGK